MAPAVDIRSLTSLKLLASAAVFYVVYKVVYRLFFHPLSKVPGPWYAAISSVYEFWWQCLRDGRYFIATDEMHKRYGPIVRINPWEAHINDPTFMDTLWSNSKMMKDPFFYGGFGIYTATFSTVSAEAHRIRRGAMAQFFSKANVAKLEPRVLSYIKRFCERVEEHKNEDKVVDISNAYRCLFTDITTDYAVPKTRNFLEHPTFSAAFNRAVRDTGGVPVWNRHFPILWPIVTTIPLIPRRILAFLFGDGPTLGMIDNQLDFQAQVQGVISNDGAKEKPNILKSIYEDPSIPASEKTAGRLFDETVSVIGAGTETTGNTMAVLTYHVTANPQVQKKLKAEVSKAAAAHGIEPHQMLTIRTIESIPYLQAIMKEALRVAAGVCGRMGRVNPDTAMTYTSPAGKSYVLPAGTTVSMTIRDIHLNESIFKDAKSFNPNRWLDGTPEEIAKMEKYLVPFGKGVRGCLGLELAKQEILLVAANLFWKFDLELYGTGEQDIALVHDYFAPFPAVDSKGVRVRVQR